MFSDLLYVVFFNVVFNIINNLVCKLMFYFQLGLNRSIDNDARGKPNFKRIRKCWIKEDKQMKKKKKKIMYYVL